MLNEGNEPAHIQVIKENGTGKIWLYPTLKIAYMHNFTHAEVKTILKLTKEHQEQFKSKWDEYFNKK